MRVTLADVAREAGVSTATVDRVLNGRSGVRPRTREIVTRAAQQLGYIDDAIDDSGPSRPAPARQPLIFDIILPAGTNTYIEDLRQQFASQRLAIPGTSLRVHVIEGFNPATLAARLAAVGQRSDGVALIGPDHPMVREAIRALVANGVPVVTLASDIPHAPRAGFVGIDNRSAGRLAGWLVGRFLGPGPHRVALFAGSLSYRGHEEREAGFRHIITEEFPDLTIIDLTEVLDDVETAYHAAAAHLDAHHDIAAIYNIGAGNRGIARALRERGLAGKVIMIGHELTPHTKAMLLDGTMDAAIDQNARVEVREVIAQLTRLACGESWAMHPLRITVFFRENLPAE